MGAPKLDLASMTLPELLAYYEAHAPVCECGRRFKTYMHAWMCAPCRTLHRFPVQPDWSKAPHYDDMDDAHDDWAMVYGPRGASGGRFISDTNDEYQREVATLEGRFDMTPGR